MKDNKSIFNEAFFKKASYEEKRAKRLPQYEPVDLKKNKSLGGSKAAIPGPAYQVTDTDEVKRRLTGAFGVTFGNNSVKSMASRSIKEFPIVISDAVEPETALMIKKLVEEQYAEYINLLISNQVVNLADYSANNEDGNIAIQALDHISGSDFRRSRIADKAANSENVDADTLFQNIPIYNLLRENQKELKTGDSITDTLLEGALVIPSSEIEKLIEFYDLNADDIAEILTEEPKAKDRDSKETDLNNRNTVLLKQYMLGDENYNDDKKYVAMASKVGEYNIYADAKRGMEIDPITKKEVFNKLTTGDIVLDKSRFDSAINRSVGELLTMPENVEIRDKFEKATFLLQSRRISGIEYYQYLTLRLGIPVSDSARLELVRQFKVADIRKYGQGKYDTETATYKNGYVISKEERKMIAENRRKIESTLKKILNTKLGQVLLGVGAVAGTTATGVGIAAAATGALSGAGFSLAAWFTALPPLAIGAIAGCAIGGAGFLLYKLIKKIKEKRQEKLNKARTEGWERVEMLIAEMEKNQADIRASIKGNLHPSTTPVDYDKFSRTAKTYNDIDDAMDKKISKSSADLLDDEKYIEDAQKDYLQAIEDTNQTIKKYLKESAVLTESMNPFDLTFKECFKDCLNNNDIIMESIIEIANESANDEHLKAELLAEKTLATTTMPMTTKYVEKKDNKDILITPSFMTRASYAYGSAEIDRKALKDRRYNQPLIMTIRFKERFDDDKYSDSELTAVIGILGRIIRVPSEEMTYVLQESANGKTLDGIFASPDGLKDAVADMFNTTKISKDLKNLPQSADIWKNLEKVTTLAAANRISGRRSGNISNAHIVFSQKEIDNVRMETGIDFLKDVKKSIALMKRYSAFTLMVANDAGQRMNILDDQDAMSWNVVPYSALSGKDSGDQLSAALTKMMRL